MQKPSRLSLFSFVVLICLTIGASAQTRRPLTPTDIDAIARLVMLEDTRQFDEAVLAGLLQSAHPEVRRRAVVAIARIVNPKGSALLAASRTDKDPEVVAATAFAYGQLKDPAAVAWLTTMMETPGGTAREAARSLGKIRTPEAQAALAQYLSTAPSGKVAAPVVGEALLALGRFTPPGDITPVVRWARDPDAEIRWRAAWAMFRLRNAAASPHLLRLSEDVSADVRFWAVRGLSATLAASGGLEVEKVAARLRAAVKDSDRRVRTEAVRLLDQYDDEASRQVLFAALDSPDSWLAVSAAEGLARLREGVPGVLPKLIAATAATRPTSVRLTALTPLVTLAPESALEAATALIRIDSSVARSSALQALGRLGPAGQTRLEALRADPATKEAAAAPVRGARAEPLKRSEAEYRQIVERWIVPAYKGSPRPRAVLGTPRGEIELELHAGDAPLGLEYFIRVVETGEIVGTEFGRVVPNFVAQQRPIRNDVVLRDEVSRLGLTRGNLSWASSGLDTGRPGYTLGSTPQPHNEGDFTALGRVVRGMDVVDRLELGDKITSAKMKR